jgi:hypothetical protein
MTTDNNGTIREFNTKVLKIFLDTMQRSGGIKTQSYFILKVSGKKHAKLYLTQI